MQPDLVRPKRQLPRLTFNARKLEQQHVHLDRLDTPSLDHVGPREGVDPQQQAGLDGIRKWRHRANVIVELDVASAQGPEADLLLKQSIARVVSRIWKLGGCSPSAHCSKEEGERR
ncbi:hypothetical protein [Ramlibacter albus]|uniref:Uncharacterized protein n=1 Tax=Ramlibacter albus TaxID=2079448 RepID=A0A923S5G0_9BURK|nr:hypothetical protein [Ramlibacter albus]MBC5765127.1 hypothetical protein [Ramlibacter albus]